MGTNKDQAQAHQFMLQRVISALTVHEADPEQPPFRRPILAAIGGIVIGVLIMAAFWVIGLLVGGGDRFTSTDVIAVEEETGARFVLLNDKLHPVANYMSALLALDKHAEVEMVSRETLSGIPVGSPIGIPGAPDSLPGKDQLLTDGWAMCDKSTVDDQGRRRDRPVLLVGQVPHQDDSPNGGALLVHSDNRVYLVHNGYRHEVAAGADVALDLANESAVTVDSTWLDTVPAGKPIAPIPLADAGEPSSAVPGKRLLVGQLVEVANSASIGQNGQGGGVDRQHYLVLGDQLRSISPLAATIQRIFPYAEPPVVLSSRDLVNAHRGRQAGAEVDDPPWTRPRFLTVDNPRATVCAAFRPGTTVPTIVVDASLPSSVLSASDDKVRVAVEPHHAALIEVMSGPEEPANRGTIALVTDQGRLYPLADPEHVMQVLGLDGAKPVRITATLADRVPRGQALSPEAARTPVGGD